MGNIVFLKKVKNYQKLSRGGVLVAEKKGVFRFVFSKKFMGAKFGITRVFMKNKKLIFVI